MYSSCSHQHSHAECVLTAASVSLLQDYPYQLASAVCEWIVAFSFICFFLTYIEDFKVSITPFKRKLFSYLLLVGFLFLTLFFFILFPTAVYLAGENRVWGVRICNFLIFVWLSVFKSGFKSAAFIFVKLLCSYMFVHFAFYTILYHLTGFIGRHFLNCYLYILNIYGCQRDVVKQPVSLYFLYNVTSFLKCTYCYFALCSWLLPHRHDTSCQTCD